MVAPHAVSSAASGDATTEVTACVTVTTVAPSADPADAVTVAVPLPTAVASPDAFTLATEVSVEDQLKPASVIAWPFWSSTSATTCAVAPSAVSIAESGVRVTVAAVTVSVGVAVGAAVGVGVGCGAGVGVGG